MICINIIFSTSWPKWRGTSGAVCPYPQRNLVGGFPGCWGCPRPWLKDFRFQIIDRGALQGDSLWWCCSWCWYQWCCLWYEKDEDFKWLIGCSQSCKVIGTTGNSSILLLVLIWERWQRFQIYMNPATGTRSNGSTSKLKISNLHESSYWY